jgi:hypothetical protein
MLATGKLCVVLTFGGAMRPPDLEPKDLTTFQI